MAVGNEEGLDGHFVEIYLEGAARVVEHDDHRRSISAGRRMRAVENEVLGALPAHALHRLLAERKSEGLGNITLARPVRPHNRRRGR